jgi:cell division protein FtsZ
MIHFEIPKNQSSIIKVIGVGGGGSNAVNYMHTLGIDGVDFVVCNTDSQALALSPVANKIQLGPHLTQGLGAGANPEVGKQSCEESLEDIAKILKVNTRMAFITAGMGGGTGTGGAPVVSKICRDLGILTVGIVTTPFTYEGRKRMKQAQDGIDKMRDHVDTILIISNDKLRQQFGNLPFTQAFAKADDILATAAKCITDVITTTGQINVDFADVCTVMKNGGVAILGSASAIGDNRALMAVEEALNSPLLNDSDIMGAKWLLLNITSAAGEFEHTMDEAEAIQAYVQNHAGDNCDVILGMGHDPNLKEKIAVTIIATGFNMKEINLEMPVKNNEPEKIIVKLGDANAAAVDAPFAEAKTARQPENMAPVLVEMPAVTYNVFDPKPAVVEKEEVSDSPQPVEEQMIAAAGTNHFYMQEERRIEEMRMQLIMKTEEISRQPSRNPYMDQHREQPKEQPKEQVREQQKEPVAEQPKEQPREQVREQPREQVREQPRETVFRGERQLTEDELEEKKRFEEQKKSLEDRAERLRRMSFNIKGSENSDEMEAVPAYLRKNKKLDNQASSSDSFYSGYSIGVNDDQNNAQASIQTINTFLDGNKPD